MWALRDRIRYILIVSRFTPKFTQSVSAVFATSKFIIILTIPRIRAAEMDLFELVSIKNGDEKVWECMLCRNLTCRNVKGLVQND